MARSGGAAAGDARGRGRPKTAAERAAARARAAPPPRSPSAERTVGPRTAGVLEASDTANGMPLPVLLALIALGLLGASPASPARAGASRAWPPRCVVAGSRALAASAALGARSPRSPSARGAARSSADHASVEVLIVLAGRRGLGLAVLYIRPGRALRAGDPGPVRAAGALTGLSLTWSIGPDLTLEETARTLAYLAAFAAAVGAARCDRTPRSWCWERAARLDGGRPAGPSLTRVWPGALAETVLGARLSGSLEYWNALGSMAALGTPAALWLGARREGGRRPRARPAGDGGPGAHGPADPVAQGAGRGGAGGLGLAGR